MLPTWSGLAEEGSPAALAEPEGPDWRRVSDSKGEKAGCTGGVDESTEPPRAASLLVTLRGGAGCCVGSRCAAGGGGAAMRPGTALGTELGTEGRDALPPPAGN